MQGRPGGGDQWLPVFKPVDLRSDAVTRPTSAMWEAMRADPLDWSRDGDSTVAELEARIAALMGKPEGLFLPSGTMANTLAACVWTRPGDRFVVDATAHVLRSEGGAYERVAQLKAHRVSGPGGHPTVAQLAAALDGSDRLALLWLENTHTYAGGTVAPSDASREICALASRSDVRVHLDGARVWNAAVATGRSTADLAVGADSVTVNINKGLGCPAGAVLCGPQDFVKAARELTVALGGFVAQAGLLAAAGLVALDDYEKVIRRDHELAARLARGLRASGVEVDPPETNIVLVGVADAGGLRARLERRGVLAFVRDPSTIRFVTHRQIGDGDIERVVAMAGVLTAS